MNWHLMEKMMNVWRLLAISVMSMTSCMAEYESNIWGIHVVESTNRCTYLSVPWVANGGADAISISNLVLTTNLQAGDEVYCLCGSANYECWKVVEDQGKLRWQEMTTVSANAITCVSNNLSRGNGFLLNRANPNGAIYLQGQYLDPGDGVVTTISRRAGVNADTMTMLAPPNGGEVTNLNDLEWSGVYDGDQLQVQTTTRVGVPQVYIRKNGKWGRWKTVKVDGKGLVSQFETDCHVSAGDVICYIANKQQGDGVVSVKWSN